MKFTNKAERYIQCCWNKFIFLGMTTNRKEVCGCYDRRIKKKLQKFHREPKG